VAAAYDELAAAEPDRFVVLDALQPPDAVLSAALSAVAPGGSGEWQAG
jgi:dTMP kinase